jgi:hypothetical protein
MSITEAATGYVLSRQPPDAVGFTGYTYRREFVLSQGRFV